MFVLILLFFLGSFVRIMAMEGINNPVSQKKCIYRFDSDNNCIKKFGKRNGTTFRLSPTGRKTLQCDPSPWQKYFVGLSDPQRFEIYLDKHCIVTAGVEQLPDKYICLPAHQNFRHLKEFVSANYVIILEDFKKDCCSIFDTLDLFEQYLFTTQILLLRKSCIAALDETLTNYAENKNLYNQSIITCLQNFINVTEPQYRKDKLLYQITEGILNLTATGSFLMMYFFLLANQVRIDAIATCLITAYLSLHTNQCIKNLDQTYLNLKSQITNMKKKYEPQN